MRDRLTTCGELVGATAITAGCAMWSTALAFIVGGAVLIGVSVLAADR
jgi:hypothetical protein